MYLINGVEVIQDYKQNKTTIILPREMFGEEADLTEWKDRNEAEFNRIRKNGLF